ncbi:hypothetical protein [Halorubrum sp. DTA46]|uniref:hypothetical protein n=1 Tax=Halorubrum sp. DTA46 TaxID=3402162 RepID=UPI003AAA253B
MTDTTAPDDSGSEPSLGDRLRRHVSENRRGMLHDLVFALAWVTLVSLLFDYVFVNAPTWAYYMFMLAGIPAYFGFFISLDMAREQR